MVRIAHIHPAMVLVPRYSYWYGPLVVMLGKSTPDGPAVASLAVANIHDSAPVQI